MLIEPVTIITFSIAVVILALTPGPDLFLVVSRGLTHGKTAAAFTALGFFLAGIIQVPLLAFGLATLVSQNPIAFDAIRYAGAIYLIWRGLKMLSGAVVATASDPSGLSNTLAMREGFIASLVNPKSHVFMLAFLPQFVDPALGSVTTQFIILGFTMRVVALTVEITIAACSAAIGAILRQYRWLQLLLERSAGLLIACIGIRLLFMDTQSINNTNK